MRWMPSWITNPPWSGTLAQSQTDMRMRPCPLPCRSDLKSLPYLKCCIKESLRLFPPVCIVGRKLAQDTTIEGHVMPAGAFVFAQIFAMHRNPNYWENPEVGVGA